MDKKTRFIVLPYLNRKADEYRRRIKNLIPSSYPQVDFNIAFQAPMTVWSMFSFKGSVKANNHKSQVVYKKVKRNTLPELNGYCSTESTRTRAGHPLTSPPPRSIRINTLVMRWTTTKLKSLTQLEVKKLLHIIKSKSDINRQLGSQSSYEIKTILIRTGSVRTIYTQPDYNYINYFCLTF